MSVSAGRVLPIPKGAYVAGTTYQMLDVVSYNGNAYVAKRQNKNVTPTDGADWMLLVQGGGVSSFNGRNGAVTPTSGDYDADQIDYDPTDSGLTATDVQEAIDELANRPSGGVSGVKGNSESTYRTGNVNLTAANIGALATNGNSQNCTSTFTSSDTTDANATSWTSVTAITSGATHNTLFTRMSQMFKNVRYLYKVLKNTIGTFETSSTASRAYAIGERFVYSGALYKATAAIASGGTISTGSSGNAVLADNISDQIFNEIKTRGTLAGTTITTTETTGNVGNNWKFSDWSLILVAIHTSGTFRGYAILPMATFASSGRVIHITFKYSTIWCTAVITYVSDTSFKYKLSESVGENATLVMYGLIKA